MTVVEVMNDVYGDSFAVAHEVDGLGLVVEMSYAPPIGTEVTVRFPGEGCEILALAEVDRHLRSRSGDQDVRLIGMRIVRFFDAGEPLPVAL